MTTDELMALADTYANAACNDERTSYISVDSETVKLHMEALEKARAALLAAVQEFTAEKVGELVAWQHEFIGDHKRLSYTPDCAWVNDETRNDAIKITPLYTAAPQPAQPESIECDCGRIHKKTAYGWASSEPAQPVAQPLHEGECFKNGTICARCGHDEFVDKRNSHGIGAKE